MKAQTPVVLDKEESNDFIYSNAYDGIGTRLVTMEEVVTTRRVNMSRCSVHYEFFWLRGGLDF